MTAAVRPRGLLGLHHVALFVPDLDACLVFYRDLLGMRVEWQPDADNVYLTSGSDNLALHRLAAGSAVSGTQRLDHIGFILHTPQSVDDWSDYLAAHGVKIAQPVKTHRDGARSFYCFDPADNLVQFIHHPPISDRLAEHAV